MYFDGQAARIVAFRLGDVEWPYDSQEISGLIASLPPEAELITISGNLSTDVASQRGVANLESIAGLPWRETFDSQEHAAKSGLQSFANYTINARSFDYADQLTAELRRRKVVNSGITTKASQPKSLSARQLFLIEEWGKNHSEVTPENLALAAAMKAVVLHDDVWVVSATKDDVEVGLGILTQYGEALQFIQMYPQRGVPNVGDALMDASIQLAKKRGCHTLNMGHSAIPSLEYFKRSWGARPGGPEFCALTFGNEAAWQAASQGALFWHQRVALPAWPPALLDTQNTVPQSVGLGRTLAEPPGVTTPRTTLLPGSPSGRRSR
ncbi:MAG: hypothetical protein DLM55_10770 [Acidimicrobiales bacterium]|nr:MAG: hypothetical protein DLM55_10770 [Acidimicrobiales bacterium]